MMSKFDTVMGIVGLEADEIDMVKNAGIKQFNHFVTVPQDELKTAWVAEGMKTGDMNDVLTFQQWYCTWRSGKPAHGVLVEFTKEFWWEHLVLLCSMDKMVTTLPPI